MSMTMMALLIFVAAMTYWFMWTIGKLIGLHRSLKLQPSTMQQLHIRAGRCGDD